MPFIDEVTIQVIGGDGGNGFIGWRREMYVPRGGPLGGDGGNGGAVILVAEPGLHTLLDFSYSPILRAETGSDGEASGCHGRGGTDIIKGVPVGTQVLYEDSLVADLAEIGARWIAARGGRGGKGNAFFKSATNQSPDYAQQGQKGESWTFRLVLKLVADVGIIGLPNVGKSTFISKISAAHPRIADYPFTTLQPQLGVVHLDEKIYGKDNRFVIADIPGLIAGAHQGKGLGTQFLRHIERTGILVQLIDVTTSLTGEANAFSEEQESLPDEKLIQLALSQFDLIEKELCLFSSSMGNYPRVVVFSKGDLPLVQKAFLASKETFTKKGFQTYLISSVTGEGVSKLVQSLGELVGETRALTKTSRTV